MIEETGPSSAVGPRIRWGAISWAAIAGLVAAATLYFAADPTRRINLSRWLLQLTPGGIVLIVALAIGTLLVILGLLAAIRSAGRRQNLRGGPA